MIQRANAERSHPHADECVLQLKDWIIQNNKHAVGMDLDTDIIDSRLIDSLQFISFLLMLEELRGAEIPEQEVTLDNFRTLRTIRDKFLLARGPFENAIRTA